MARALRAIMAMSVAIAFANGAFAQPASLDAGHEEALAWPIPSPSDELPVTNWLPTPETEMLAAAPAAAGRFRESTWYTRVDYFHWNERIDGGSLLNESGALWTLGYQRRVGIERFRGEFFAADVHYASRIDYWDGSSEPFTSRTYYLGLEGEYDLLFQPAVLPTIDWFAGLGTRFWIRDLPDDVTPSGTFVFGYQETWWTVYPYLGAARRRLVQSGPEFYWSGRIGFTAINFLHATNDDIRLYPRPGLVGTLEGGIRDENFFFGCVAETMNWGESPEMRGWVQPASSFILLGVRTGFSF